MHDLKAENDLIREDDEPHLFTGIPTDLLIGQPLQAVAQGQQELCQTYIHTIEQLTLNDDSSTEDSSCN